MRQTRSDALEQYEGQRTDYIVIRGLAKVLEDAADFHPIDMPIIPADLRQNYSSAARLSPSEICFIRKRAPT